MGWWERNSLRDAFGGGAEGRPGGRIAATAAPTSGFVPIATQLNGRMKANAGVTVIAMGDATHASPVAQTPG
ncbi:hypothetical protein GCM10007160_37420 [Litchfieldella qijiaojingensis]|uniref:Uncharacterized protein n=1 Tax=Litchfieldella qijiaojingensis TaxID=980347 RepID=A0ABQ2Z7U8_9GAMM|nr:hypothetical protein GCM10007160_37420 [Halomonas qijiaojingensis]